MDSSGSLIMIIGLGRSSLRMRTREEARRALRCGSGWTITRRRSLTRRERMGGKSGCEVGIGGSEWHKS